MSKDKKIVVTGIGPIASAGIGKKAFWDGILNKNTGLELVKCSLNEKVLESYYLHKIKNFDIENFGIEKEDLDYISKWKEGNDNADLFLLLAAVKLALDDSKIDYKTKENNLGLVATHENPCLEQLLWKVFKGAYQLLKNQPDIDEIDFFNELYYKTVKVGYETQSFMPLFHIARTFNIHKYSIFINNACASGLYAIEAASDMIRQNKVPAVIIVAGDYPDIFKHLWFKMIGMYAKDGKIKPFSKDGRGFVLGEGSAALILEDYEHAKKRNAHIYAEYLGGGFKLEGWGVTTPMIGSSFYQETILEALKNSALKKEDIDLICAHGTGTASSDYYEAKAIADVFGNSAVPVTAFKPYIGHNLGGSTLLELSILLFALENNAIPPTLNCDNISPHLSMSLVREKKEISLKTVMKICCAFAGYNAAAVFKKLEGN